MAYTTIGDLLVGICDAIRNRLGTANKISHQKIPELISSIGNFSSNGASASNILVNKKAYVNGAELTGTMPQCSSSNMSVNGATITLNTAGYYPQGTNKSVSTIASSNMPKPSISDVEVKADGGIWATASYTPTKGYVSDTTEVSSGSK